MIRPIILSGGGGTRLWPLSRTGNPKQFHRLVGNHSLLQATAQRCRGPLFYDPVISTGENQRFFVLDQLESIGVAPAAIVLEPAARNTAPAIAAAAFWALARGEDDPLLVAPSDHVIGDDAALHAAVAAGLPYALQGKLLTFGIQPARAHTGYGYIQAAPFGNGDLAVRNVQRFVEKPDTDTATGFLSDGNYFWNCGIFLFRPSVFLSELKRYAPAVCTQVEHAMAGASADGAFVRPDAATFAAVESVSIDLAVMERSNEILVVPVDFAWSDVGSWDAVREMRAADAQGNVIEGDVVALDVTNSLVRSDADLTVAVVGLDNVLCVVTHDAAFIAPLNRAQDARLVVEELRRRGHHRANEPAQVHRPWGSYRSMDRGDRFQTKRLVVKPGGKLSLQMHHHRSEHWIIVNGTAEVTLGSEVRLLQENQSVYIPAGTLHRLRNPGKVPLLLIEVQCGPYLGEDDIVRYDDDYGRSASD